MNAGEPQFSIEEQQLINQYVSGQLPRGQCHSAACEYLLRPENASHWFCRHQPLTKELLEVLVHQDYPQPRRLWAIICRQLGECEHCILYYHDALQGLQSGEYELPAVKKLLEVLWQLDRQRLLSCLQGKAQQQQQQVQQDMQEPLSLVLAVYEVLGVYCPYLDDAALCTAAVEQLAAHDWKVTADGGSRFPGFYKLLAHPNADVRAQALQIVNSLGRFDHPAWHDLEQALDSWVDVLQELLPQSQGAAVDRLPFRPCQLMPPEQLQAWQVVNIWSALKVVLGLLEDECFPELLQASPTMLPAIVVQACPAALWQHQHHVDSAHPPAAPALAKEGSMEHKHALGCLMILLKGLKQDLWLREEVLLSPVDLVQQLYDTCWRCHSDAALLRLLLQVLQVIVECLLPCIMDEDDHDDGHDEIAAGADAAGLSAADCKLAVGKCLQLLLVQLPGSDVVPLLIRGLALQAGLACCNAALQSPSCPSTATFCHVWGPVCADVLYMTQETLGLQHIPGVFALQQHQTPGKVKLMPLLGQMEDLRSKVVRAAADLVSLAIQVDAAVLHAILDPHGVHPGNRSRLVPGALDIVEVAVNNKTNFKCAPFLWGTLQGCGHSTVSATYAAVAAELAPLMSAAKTATEQLRVGPEITAWLQASLQLPSESVDPSSRLHAVYALDYAGWLHGQLLQAAVKHLAVCSMRSRFFLLPPVRNKQTGPKGSQLKIDSLFQQLTDSCTAAEDSTAPEPYALCVRSCCSLLLLGKENHPAKHVAHVIENALLSSCGLAAGQLQLAVEQHLLQPGSSCAMSVVEALQEALQDLQKHRIQRVIAESPERVAALLQLTHFCLAAALKPDHGLDTMLPMFSLYLPNFWRVVTDSLDSSPKLLSGCTVCNTALVSNGQLQQQLQQQGSGSLQGGGSFDGDHLGPPCVGVLKVLLQSLPTAWQCYQALVQQRLEQRRLYMASLDTNESPADHAFMYSQSSQGDATPGFASPSQHTHSDHGPVEAFLRAELQKEMKWIVSLLQLGGRLHATSRGNASGGSKGNASGGSRGSGSGGHGSGSSGTGCSPCAVRAVAEQQLQNVWSSALEQVVRVTATPLSKAVKTAAADLLRSDSPSLDKVWLARLVPDAAPGTLASTGLGNWPSHILSKAGSGASSDGAPGRTGSGRFFVQPAAVRPSSAPAADGASAPGAAGATEVVDAEPAAQVATGVSEPEVDLVDLTLDEDWVGNWLSEGEDNASSEQPSEDAAQQHLQQQQTSHDLDSADVYLISSSEDEQQEDAVASPRQLLHSSAWPWSAALQQQQQQQLTQQKQAAIKQGVSKLLKCSKSLNATQKQHQRQQEGLSLQEVLAGGSSGRSAAAAASAGDAGFEAVMASLAEATKASKQGTGDVGREGIPPATAAAAGKSRVSHLLQSVPLASRSKLQVQPDQQKASSGGRPTPTVPPAASAAPAKSKQKRPRQGAGQQQQQKGQQPLAPAQQSAAPETEIDLDALFDEGWGGSNLSATGAGSSATWNVGKYNFSAGSRRPSRQRQAAAMAGLSKADQIRADLLGRAPNGAGSRATAPPAAGRGASAGGLTGTVAELLQRAGSSRSRDMAPPDAAGQQRAVGSTRGTAQQQRWPQQQLEQQQRELGQQRQLAQLQREKELQRQAAATAAAERAAPQQQEQVHMRVQQPLQPRSSAAASASELVAAAHAPMTVAAPAAAPAAVHLISDGALFARAAADAVNRSRLAGGLTRNGIRRPGVLRKPHSGFGLGDRRLGAQPAANQAAAPTAPVRYYPPIKPEYVENELLSWGYLGAIGSSSGEGVLAAARQRWQALRLEGPVPLRFESSGHYCHVFRALLLEELRAGLAAAYEELISTGGARGNNGGGIGSFRCMPFLIESVQRVGSIYAVEVKLDTTGLQPRERDSPRERDFAVVTKVQLSSAAELADDCIPRSHLSGLVTEAKMEQPGVRKVVLKVCPASAGSELMSNYWTQQLLRVGGVLWMTMVSSLVPNFREIEALCAVQNVQDTAHLLKRLLDPSPPSTPLCNSLALPDPSMQSNKRGVRAMSAQLRKALMDSYNVSQQAAIAASLDRSWPLVLVQGPPGTGKTSAILGIVSALLAVQGSGRRPIAAAVSAPEFRKPKPRRKAGSSVAESEDGRVLPGPAAATALQIGSTPTVRVLVCAQSNAAIDELATRLANDGVWCESGSRRPPAMVRIGRSEATHASVRMFHVDALADQHLHQRLLHERQQQQEQQLQQIVRAGPAAAAAAAAEQQEAVQAKLQKLKERYQQIEQELAALAKEPPNDKQATAVAAKAAGVAGAADQHDMPHSGEKRSRAMHLAVPTALVEDTAGKKQRTTVDAAAKSTSGNREAVAAAAAASSGSDMELSDGERAPAAYRKNDAPQSTAATGIRYQDGSSYSKCSTWSGRDRSDNRESSDRKTERRRSRSRSMHREGDSRRSSKANDSSKHKRRSRSRSRGRYKYSRQDGVRDKTQRRRDSSRDRRRRSRSSSRGRSRDRQREGRRARSSSSRERNRRRERSRSTSGARHRRSNSRERREAAAVGHNSKGKPDEQQRQQQRDNCQPPQTPQQQAEPAVDAAVRIALLRDEQRALKAQMRALEMEQLQNRGPASGQAARDLDRQRPQMRQAVVAAAEIVLCTLSAAGGELLKQCPPFDVLVVDEAAQALEPATLIPISLVKPKEGRVVLVGDPCQLPPTVLSKVAEAAMLSQSLFERLAKAGWPVTMLQEQYRMHPDISAFPSRFFYDGQLLNGATITAASKGAAFHSKLAFKPFVVWDCRDGRERGGGSSSSAASGRAGGSLRNTGEAQLAATLVFHVLQSYAGEVGSVAVISPYKAQVLALKDSFRRQFGSEAALTAANIEFGTVDGFQGREADIVVFSCVRAQPEAAAAAGWTVSTPNRNSSGCPAPVPATAAEAGQTAAAAGPRIGFLADVRRMNVGLTRGRRGVWVVCHADTLAASPAWRPLLQEARARGVLLEAREPFAKLCTAKDERLLRGMYWTPSAPVVSMPANKVGSAGTQALAAFGSLSAGTLQQDRPKALAVGHQRPAAAAVEKQQHAVEQQQGQKVPPRQHKNGPAAAPAPPGATATAEQPLHLSAAPHLPPPHPLQEPHQKSRAASNMQPPAAVTAPSGCGSRDVTLQTALGGKHAADNPSLQEALLKRVQEQQQRKAEQREQDKQPLKLSTAVADAGRAALTGKQLGRDRSGSKTSAAAVAAGAPVAQAGGQGGKGSSQRASAKSRTDNQDKKQHAGNSARPPAAGQQAAVGSQSGTVGADRGTGPKPLLHQLVGAIQPAVASAPPAGSVPARARPRQFGAALKRAPAPPNQQKHTSAAPAGGSGSGSQPAGVRSADQALRAALQRRLEEQKKSSAGNRR